MVKSSIEELTKYIKKIDERVTRIEEELEISEVVKEKSTEARFVPQVDSSSEQKKSNKENTEPSVEMPDFTFNQIISILGIGGIVIGIISFFFYAIARNWIGETAQIGIGILVGFAMFALAYALREKKAYWSNIVFGGAYLIEYITIAVGVHTYEVMPVQVALILCLIFILSSMMLSHKFASRAIAYFSLIGGFWTPFAIGLGESDLFVLFFYISLSIALVILSSKYNWADVRAVSFFFMIISIMANISDFVNTNNLIAISYIIAFFILYNIAPLIFVLKNLKEEINILDIVILGLVPLITLLGLNAVLDIQTELFGVLVLLISFIYLGEIAYIKKKYSQVKEGLTYTLLSAGYIALNVGLLFVLDKYNEDFLMILFAIEWVLFNYISNIFKDKMYYRICSYIFLGLTSLWYFVVLRFNEGQIHATFFLIFLGIIVGIFYYLFNKDIDFKVNAAGFIISGFLFIFSFVKYLAFFIDAKQTRDIILSILWLIYTLYLFSNVRTQEGKALVGALLGITLLNIVLFNLLELSGAFRIIGFILFGVLLLAGGYYIKNETDKK